jgi:hypothetical protein
VILALLLLQALGPVYEAGKQLACKIYRPGPPGHPGKMLEITISPRPYGFKPRGDAAFHHR